MLLAQVALFSPPYATLSYRVPDYLPHDIWRPGLRVLVPLGKGVRAGIVLSLDTVADPCLHKSTESVGVTREACEQTDSVVDSVSASSAETTFDEREAEQKLERFILKPLVWPLEFEPLLSPEYINLAEQLANRQNTTIGRILGNLIPAGFRSAQSRFRFFINSTRKDFKGSALAKLPATDLIELGRVWIAKNAEVLRTGQDPLDSELYALQADPPWAVRPAAKTQLAVLEYLYEHGTVSRRRLIESLGTAIGPVITTLVQRGLISLTNGASVPLVADYDDSEQDMRAISENAFFALTPHQQEVFEPLAEVVQSATAETRLLFGITGSGKTAVYLELARLALRQGRSVLLLAPEVALALKLWRDVQRVLPEAPQYLFHGYQNATVKEQTFWNVAHQQTPCIIVGTRSALFLPITDVGLIVLDEEHDSSFKQDEGFFYQAKEVAWYKAGKDNALLLMGSATPDVKSFYAAQENRIVMHRLAERVGGGTLPEVQLLTLPKGQATDGVLVPEAMAALRDAVTRGEQAVIMLNRRGYAPLMYCLSCATVAKCPHCDIALAYHKGRERLVCHYCGYSHAYPTPCSHCRGIHFLPMGEGTEKIEEHLAVALPAGTGVLRLDRDSTRRPGKMEEILQQFANKEAGVLVGTQMLSKGHHFPDVTLVIVADADLGLNLPDYRAAERTFQLIVQSSGRSGRGEKSGKVFIQTRDPSHYCWQFVRYADYEGFYAHEIELRKKRRYPPFVRLALIRMSFTFDSQSGAADIASLGQVLRAKGKELGLTVLGPAPAPIPFLQGRKRFHCLVKGDDWQVIRSLFSAAVSASKKSSIRLSLDLDPVNML